ncbi:MAG: zinc dependent phospholipase C family protein [Bacteroidia bacterium]
MIRFSNWLIVISYWLFQPATVFGWGFTAHKQINNAAVFTLPPELFKFYKVHIAEITDKAVNADMRRYAFADEACKHYLDADHYEKSFPLDTIPYRWNDALVKYGKDTLIAYGIGPWHLQLIKYQLTKAFEEKNLYLIIKLSADLGHYAADLHVPLHATLNYNGQYTGQEGIHGLWESRVYELFCGEYDFLLGRASYISNINETVWQRFSQSFAALDSVLLFEKLATEKYPNKYVLKNSGRNSSKIYNETFCNYYHLLLNGMVERRARASIELVGSLWFTCWVDAGQPNLDNLKEEPTKEEEENEKNFLQSLFEKGKMIGRKED